MGRIVNLEEKFREWFDEPESFSWRFVRAEDDVQAALERSQQEYTEMLHKWLRAAYMQGCKDMSKDCLDTLSDYATAVAGCAGKTYTSEEAFDASRENLQVYFDDVFSTK